jgi:hypothetical protein
MIELELVVRHPQGEPDIYRPIFVCDFCGKKIENLRRGLYYWKWDEKCIPVPGTLKMIHKGDCVRAVEARGEEVKPCDELGTLIGWLPNSYNASWSDLLMYDCPSEQLQQVQATIQKRLKSQIKEQ